MAQIKIVASTSLRRLRGCESGTAFIDVIPGTSVAQVLKDMGAVPGEIGIMVLNGEKVGQDAMLYGGETLELYPIFGGG